MIFIHGGSFTLGSAIGYTPSELVTENDVIVVVIQYRLGVLGFLSSGDNVTSGNYGLWDQNLAIHWVKDNIRSFGGDPTSMTIFGESAGAASVGYQMLTPYSKGLFSRVLFQSGTPLTSWSLNKDPAWAFYYLANQTGCLPSASWSDRFYYTLTGGLQQSEHQRILTCLRRVDVPRLLQYISLLPEGENNPWIPSVDGDFVPRDPADLLRDANYLVANDVSSRDVMMGVNNDEGSLLLGLNLELNGELMSIFLGGELLYQYEELGDNEDRIETLTNVLKFFYTESLTDGPVPLQATADALADRYFAAPAVTFMRDLANLSAKGIYRGRLYLYHFNHYPARKAGQEGLKGIYHAEDLAYQFDGVSDDVYLSRDEFTTEDYTLASTFKSMVTNFAKTGRPQLSLQTEAGGPWPEFTMAEEKYLSLEPVPRVDSHLYKKRLDLWLDLIPSLVNTTRVETQPTSWNLPWQQSDWNSNCNTNYNTNYNPSRGQALFSQGQTFYFRGRITFFKLH